MKNVEDEEKQDKLMEDIGMKEINNKIKKIVRDEYGDELRKVELKNTQLQKENTKIQQENTQLKENEQKYAKKLQLFEKSAHKITNNPNITIKEVKKIINDIIIT